MWEDYLKWIPQEYHSKYKKPGIYSISIDDELVYIGKSENMLKRLCGHMQSIEEDTKSNKYKVLREARIKGYTVSFDVMEEVKDLSQLGEREGVLIRAYLPPLNYQIPKEENWRHWTANRRAKVITLEEILNPINRWERFDF